MCCLDRWGILSTDSHQFSCSWECICMGVWSLVKFMVSSWCAWWVWEKVSHFSFHHFLEVWVWRVCSAYSFAQDFNLRAESRCELLNLSERLRPRLAVVSQTEMEPTETGAAATTEALHHFEFHTSHDPSPDSLRSLYSRAILGVLSGVIFALGREGAGALVKDLLSWLIANFFQFNKSILPSVLVQQWGPPLSGTLTSNLNLRNDPDHEQ